MEFTDRELIHLDTALVLVAERTQRNVREGMLDRDAGMKRHAEMLVREYEALSRKVNKELARRGVG
jgi:hypothetical protein